MSGSQASGVNVVRLLKRWLGLIRAYENGMKELISKVLVGLVGLVGLVVLVFVAPIHHAFFPPHHQHAPISVGGIYCLFFSSFFFSSVWHSATTVIPATTLRGGWGPGMVCGLQ